MRSEARISRTFFLIISLCMILGVVAGRGLTIKHNWRGHPDEHVFYASTELLMYDLLYDDDYEPVKPYPEATYIFRLPFHLIAQDVRLEADYVDNVCLWGRISSVFYYTIGCVAGLWLVANVLGGGKAGAVIYALAVCLSMFQIEISRYGTFDPLSFPLFMFMLLFLTQYIRRNKAAYLAAATFLAGILTAGKYSLAYFFVLPAALFFLGKDSRKKKLAVFCLLSVSAALGFVLFSPSVIKHPLFFVRTIIDGLDGYVNGGNAEGYSTIPESVFSAVVYQLFYSDLPLSTVFAVFGCVRICRQEEGGLEKKFFGIILPVTLLVFLLYNCALTTFFLRTLFPFYFAVMLYAAAGMGALCAKPKMRTLIAVLLVLMSARSVYFVSVMADRGITERRAAEIRDIAEEKGVKEAVWIGEFFRSGELKAALNGLDEKIISVAVPLESQFPEAEQGALTLCVSMEHGWAKYCVFPANKERVVNITEGWAQFKAENEQYLIGTLYPQHYYWLFGYWLHGSTATNYEFPNIWAYCKPAD